MTNQPIGVRPAGFSLALPERWLRIRPREGLGIGALLAADSEPVDLTDLPQDLCSLFAAMVEASASLPVPQLVTVIQAPDDKETPLGCVAVELTDRLDFAGLARRTPPNEPLAPADFAPGAAAIRFVDFPEHGMAPVVTSKQHSDDAWTWVVAALFAEPWSDRTAVVTGTFAGADDGQQAAEAMLVAVAAGFRWHWEDVESGTTPLLANGD